ncbi:MAG: hypothetical protein ACREL9_05860 [Gemmatimonadales bacterium]
MRRPSFAGVATLLLPVIAFTAVFAGARDPAAAPTLDPEVARIQRQLATVERELRDRDVSGLTPAQRAARVRSIEALHAYRLRGVFPKTPDFRDRAVPYFIDRYGTRCALAYLIEQSGDRDFVGRVAASRGNAASAELADNPELLAWLRQNGLTLGEAARIQSAYLGVRSSS